MNTPFFIDAAVKADIARVIKNADQRRESIHDLFRRIQNPSYVPGNQPDFVTIVPMGFKCVFTIEQQPEPLGWCRHLSVSSPDPDHAPPLDAMEMLMLEFGFKMAFRDIASKGGVFFENIPGRKGKAINVVEPLQ